MENYLNKNEFKGQTCPCDGPCNGCDYYEGCIENSELECINCGMCMYLHVF